MNGIWVVYDHPRDQPEFYIVRRHWPRADGSTLVEDRSYAFRNLDDARVWLADLGLGLVCLARHPDDDPVIIETWL